MQGNTWRESGISGGYEVDAWVRMLLQGAAKVLGVSLFVMIFEHIVICNMQLHDMCISIGRMGSVICKWLDDTYADLVHK